jgi:hypothetical protein
MTAVPATARRGAHAGTRAVPQPETQARRWLLFVHQLPPSPSNLRVSTWRRLQQLGAIPVRQAVYVLPDTPSTREDFEWLKAEVTGMGGAATVFASAQLDVYSADALVEEFRRGRQEAYTALAVDIEHALERAASRRKSSRKRVFPIRRLLATYRERLTDIERIDFFGSAGRDRVTTLLQQLEAHGPTDNAKRTTPTGPDVLDRERYRGRLWITRPRPGVDRMSSAWLIRRFIDPQARFGFAADRNAVPGDGVPFDMFGVDFSHHGDRCTFETLCAVFGISDPAIDRIAAVVHDLDLKDERFGAPDAPTIGGLLDGLQLAHADDQVLLAQGMDVFEALYRSFERAARSPRPRAVASRRKTQARSPRARNRK